MGNMTHSNSKPPSQEAESLAISPPIKVVALAAWAGGVKALSKILAALPVDFPAAIVIVQHRTSEELFHLPEILSRRTALPVEPAREGSVLRPASVFIAPPDRHLLVNVDRTLSLSRSPKVHFVRPSADRLFESLATNFGERAIAVVLSGAGSDGSGGVSSIKRMGGVVIAKEPTTADVPGMARAAIETGAVDLIVPLNRIASTLTSLVGRRQYEPATHDPVSPLFPGGQSRMSRASPL